MKILKWKRENSKTKNAKIKTQQVEQKPSDPCKKWKKKKN